MTISVPPFTAGTLLDGWLAVTLWIGGRALRGPDAGRLLRAAQRVNRPSEPMMDRSV